MYLALSKLFKNRNITKVAHMCNNTTYSDSRNCVYIVLFFLFFTYFKDISLVSSPNCRYLTQPAFPCLQNSKLDPLLCGEISLCWKSLTEAAVNINLLLPLKLRHLMLEQEFPSLQSSSFLCFVTGVAHSTWQKPDTYLSNQNLHYQPTSRRHAWNDKIFYTMKVEKVLVLHRNLWSVTF